MSFTSYNQYLAVSLEERRRARPKYSMRAMAMNLGLSASSLSDVINGKKHLSEAKALEVSRRMKLNAREARYFCTLVQFQSAKSEEVRSMLASQLRAMNPNLREQFEVSLDRFALMSEWYHTAIIEMTYLDDFKMHVENIARSLDIPIDQAQEALNLLLRLNLIEALGNGRYKKTNDKFLIQSQTPNEALRRYHHKMLALAQESLTTQTPQEKVLGSETVTIDLADLPEVREVLETCFQQVVQIAERAKKRDHVYHLGIQFFRLTERSGRNKK